LVSPQSVQVRIVRTTSVSPDVRLNYACRRGSSLSASGWPLPRVIRVVPSRLAAGSQLAQAGCAERSAMRASSGSPECTVPSKGRNSLPWTAQFLCGDLGDPGNGSPLTSDRARSTEISCSFWVNAAIQLPENSASAFGAFRLRGQTDGFHVFHPFAQWCLPKQRSTA
jgi:hypothetical protein